MSSTPKYTQALKLARGPVLLGFLVSLAVLSLLLFVIFPLIGGIPMGIQFSLPDSSLAKLIFILWGVDFVFSIYRTIAWYSYIYDYDRNDTQFTFYTLDVLGRKSQRSMSLDELYKHDLHYMNTKKAALVKKNWSVASKHTIIIGEQVVAEFYRLFNE